MNNPTPHSGEGGPKMDRQKFILTTLGGVGLCYAGALSYPVYRYLESPVEKGNVVVKEVVIPNDKKPASGTAYMFKFGSINAMLIHHADDSWVAMTAKCTHLGCTVQYEGAKDRIYCACHGGIYNPHTGANVSGPPPKPLELLNVEMSDAGVVITRIKKTA